MKHNEILELIKLFEKSSLEVLELNQGEIRLYLKKMAAASAMPAASAVSTVALPATEENTSHHKITSPMVGTFYRAPGPEAEPFVRVGDTVKKGDTLCIIEAMKMLNEIKADIDGIITEVAVENGAMVDYGKTLFLIEEKNV